MFKLVLNTILLMGFFSISNSCKDNQDNFYIYRTEEFNKKENEFRISLDEASKIYSTFILEKNKENKEIFCPLDIIYGEHYIFKENRAAYNLKTGDYNLSGVWINGNTGEIKEIQTEDNVKIILEPGKHLYYVKKIAP